MTIINHYGNTVNSDNPVTGVYSIHDPNWECIDNEICLTCEEAYQDIESDDTLTEDEKYGLSDTVECDSCHTKIIGEWLKDKDDKYYPNPEGEYAAILNETTIQVVYSQYTARHGLCSPCYPGQVDMDSIGDYLGYALPDDLLYKDES